MAEDTQEKLQLARLGHAYGLEYEMIRATAAFEHAALRTLLLLNGGGLGIYITLYAALSRDAACRSIDQHLAQLAVGGWVVGLVTAALCAFFAARSQFAFRKVRGRQVERAEAAVGLPIEQGLSDINEEIGRQSQRAECWRWAAIIAGIISFILFVAAVVPAFLSF